MNIELTPKNLFGEINAISSKSYAHRLLICAALSNEECEIKCNTMSVDITATVDCLNKLGAKITRINNVFYVKPIMEIPKYAVIDCGESGSTLRFITPIICALGINVKILMHGRLSKRPMQHLFNSLSSFGCEFSQDGDELNISGKLSNGNFEIDGDISSQYISGLLFALTKLDNSKIIINKNIESYSYIKMTIECLKMFGFEIAENNNELNIISRVLPKQKNFVVQSDWSNSAFWLCAGALSDKGVICKGLDVNSLQGDKAVLDVLKRIGAKVKIENDLIEVSKVRLNSFDLDATNIPDLVPILASIASVCDGTTNIYGAKRLRLKESDRIISTVELINNLGGQAFATEDGIKIIGIQKLKGGEVNSFNDHRIVMSAAIISAFCENEVVINDFTAINKSYPNFFEDFELLNGEVKNIG